MEENKKSEDFMPVEEPITEENANEMENTESSTGDIPASDEENKSSELVIDDSEDDSESLKKEIVKEKPKKDTTKIKRTFKKVIKIGGIVACVCIVLIVGTATFLAVKERMSVKDDAEFILDNPEDPNSYTNVAKKLDENVLPLMEFTVYGEYEAYEEKDVYSDYSFKFDPTGYYEGYSSNADDDFGKWEIISTGDKYQLIVTCTEAEDTYTLEYLDGGLLRLSNKDNTFTLTPVA